MRDDLIRDHESRFTPAWHHIALAAAVLSSVLLITVAPRHSPMAITFVVGATLACGAVAVLERRAPRLGVRLIAIAIGVVLTTAVVAPPTTSNDLWSYTMYGRIVAVHDASPYAKVPSDYRSDPFFPVSARFGNTGLQSSAPCGWATPPPTLRSSVRRRSPIVSSSN